MMLVNTIQGPLWLILQPPLVVIQLGFFLALSPSCQRNFGKKKV